MCSCKFLSSPFLHQLFFSRKSCLETIVITLRRIVFSSCWHQNSINYSRVSLYHAPDLHFLNSEQTHLSWSTICIHLLFDSSLFVLQFTDVRRLNHERLYTPHSCRKWQDQNDNFQILGGGLQLKNAPPKLWLTLRYGAWVIYGATIYHCFAFKKCLIRKENRLSTQDVNANPIQNVFMLQIDVSRCV